MEIISWAAMAAAVSGHYELRASFSAFPLRELVFVFLLPPFQSFARLPNVPSYVVAVGTSFSYYLALIGA